MNLGSWLLVLTERSLDCPGIGLLFSERALDNATRCPSAIYFQPLSLGVIQTPVCSGHMSISKVHWEVVCIFGQLLSDIYSLWRQDIRRHDHIHCCSISFPWDMIYLLRTVQHKSQRLLWAPLGRLQIFVILKHIMFFVESGTVTKTGMRTGVGSLKASSLAELPPLLFLPLCSCTPPSHSSAPIFTVKPSGEFLPIPRAAQSQQARNLHCHNPLLTTL